MNYTVSIFCSLFDTLLDWEYIFENYCVNNFTILLDNPEVVTQDDCSLYTACLWSEESQVCHMQDNDVAGYSYAEQPSITERGFTVRNFSNGFQHHCL